MAAGSRYVEDVAGRRLRGRLGNTARGVRPLYDGRTLLCHTGSAMKAPVFYPLFLDLQGKLCIVVGGGAVAGRKVRTLIAARAHVRLSAPRQRKAWHSLRLKGK